MKTTLDLREAVLIHQEIGILKNEIKNMKEDMDEIKAGQKETLQFMYKFQGGSAWLFGLIATAGTLGGVIVSVLSHLFPKAA